MQCFQPNCNENTGVKKIFNALNSNTSLKYVDANLISVDSGLIKDIAVSMNNKSKLEEIKISELTIIGDDFYHLRSYLGKISGLKSLVSILPEKMQIN